MVRRDLIIDVGAHEGDDARFYMDKGFAVVAVEANPVLVQRMKERFSEELAKGILAVEPCAIGRTNGTISFFVHKVHSVFSSVEINTEMHSKDDFEEMPVPCLPAPTIFRRYGTPHYLKIDIEGGELAVIEAMAGFDKPKFVSFELSKDYRRCLELLVDFGYGAFKLIDQALNVTRGCPFPPREGRFVSTGFSGHMSGPFGEETPGRWMGIDELIAEIDETSWEPGHWYDIHARLGSH